MAYNYKSTSFIVPKGYKNDLEAFVKQFVSWITSNFPELTFDKYSSGSKTCYAYFSLGDTGIRFEVGVFNSGDFFYCDCYNHNGWEYGNGSAISEGSTVALQLMVIPDVAMFSICKTSVAEAYENSGALVVKEIISNNSYVLSSPPGKYSDSSAKKGHFWFPSKYYYKDASNSTIIADVSVFPNNISSLEGSISKEENGGSRIAVISPVFYMQNGPLSLLTAAEDAVKLMYANDGGMPTVTNYVPIQVGSDQYIALEGSNAGSVYLKVN